MLRGDVVAHTTIEPNCFPGAFPPHYFVTSTPPSTMISCALQCPTFRPAAALPRRHRRTVLARADADSCRIPDDYSAPDPPSLEKRATLNLLLIGAVALPSAGMLGPYLASFVPRRSGVCCLEVMGEARKRARHY